jgi:ppGpp synthetase/RelA/SpoT-type nucleotidyltranferase
MRAFFSKHELALIEESLYFTKRKFEEYPGYPSVEFKQGRVKEVDDVLSKVRNAKKEAKR